MTDRFPNLNDLVGMPVDGFADLAFDFVFAGHTRSFWLRSTFTIATRG
jgi:hypothetical protein